MSVVVGLFYCAKRDAPLACKAKSVANGSPKCQVRRQCVLFLVKYAVHTSLGGRVCNFVCTLHFCLYPVDIQMVK